MKQCKKMAYICLLYLLMISLGFEIVYCLICSFEVQPFKVPIEFFLYALFLSMPVIHRIMSLIQPYNKGEVLFDLGKYLFDLYLCILFISTLYCTPLINILRWFVYVLSIQYTIYYINKGKYDNTDTDETQYILSYQLMNVEYFILMIVLCNFRMNILTMVLILGFILLSIILRVFVLIKMNYFH